MGIQHTQQSAYVQERRKWETQPVMIDSQYIAPQIIDGVKREGFMDGTFIQPLAKEQGGKYPYVMQEYPKKMYKAERADGGPRLSEIGEAGSEQERSNMKSRGWSDDPEAAFSAIKAQDLEFAKLAAERNHEMRTMSDKAKAEVEAYEDTISIHAPTIPEKKKRKYVKKATGTE